MKKYEMMSLQSLEGQTYSILKRTFDHNVTVGRVHDDDTRSISKAIRVHAVNEVNGKEYID